MDLKLAKRSRSFSGRDYCLKPQCAFFLTTEHVNFNCVFTKKLNIFLKIFLILNFSKHPLSFVIFLFS
uniref:Ovule protein n=1 Tax=Panagrolaimus sp. JU765 TaxID=591449 RepID=A0AC34QGU3_9BILA